MFFQSTTAPCLLAWMAIDTNALGQFQPLADASGWVHTDLSRLYSFNKRWLDSLEDLTAGWVRRLGANDVRF
jgi:hypothetical protein